MSFSDHLLAQFELAAQGRRRVHRKVIAGRNICFQFAGEHLKDDVLTPFAHLPDGAPSAETELTVLVWDQSSTGVPLPECPVPLEEFADRGVMHGLCGTYGDGVFQYFDKERSLAVLFVVDKIPQWARKCPLLHVFGWWAQHNGCLLLHAAVVGKGGRGVLLLGRGGSGKSSTTLAALLNGFSLASDDYILLDRKTGHSLYCTASLEYDDRDRFPQLDQCGMEPGWKDRKATFVLMPEFESELVPALELVGAVALRVAPTTPALQVLPKGRALLALAPSTLLQATHPSQEQLSAMSSLLRSIPTYLLHLSRPVEGALKELEGIL